MRQWGWCSMAPVRRRLAMGPVHAHPLVLRPCRPAWQPAGAWGAIIGEGTFSCEGRPVLRPPFRFVGAAVLVAWLSRDRFPDPLHSDGNYRAGAGAVDGAVRRADGFVAGARQPHADHGLSAGGELAKVGIDAALVSVGVSGELLVQGFEGARLASWFHIPTLAGLVIMAVGGRAGSVRAARPFRVWAWPASARAWRLAWSILSSGAKTK